jgi:hypothetical protein
MRNLGKAFLSILVGNLIYFWASPRLPYAMQHQPNHIDYGLGVDFLVCVVIYVIVDAVFLKASSRE